MRLRDWLLGAGGVLLLCIDGMGCDGSTNGLSAIGLMVVLVWLTSVSMVGCAFLWPDPAPESGSVPSKRTATTLPPPPASGVARDLMDKAESMLSMSRQLQRDAYQLRAIAQRLEDQ
jgi:hypothetical protein